MEKKLKCFSVNEAKCVDSLVYIPCEANLYHATIYSSLHLATLSAQETVLSNSCNVFDFYAKHFNINVMSNHGVYKVSNLHYFPNANPSYTNPNIFNTIAFNLFLQSTKSLLKQVDNCKSLVYIKRTSTQRNIQNTDDFEKMLVQKGFQICIMENYTLQTQIDICHNAKFILGVHGAGLTHIIYCKPECIVLELKHKGMNSFRIHNCYGQLASYANLKYYSHYYTQYTSKPNFKSKDYSLVVNIKELSSRIDENL